MAEVLRAEGTFTDRTAQFIADHPRLDTVMGYADSRLNIAGAVVTPTGLALTALGYIIKSDLLIGVGEIGTAAGAIAFAVSLASYKLRFSRSFSITRSVLDLVK